MANVISQACALVVVGALLLIGCAPTAPAGSGPRSAAPAAQAPASDGAGSGSPAPADWQARWGDLVAAAKREGTLALSGPPSPETRRGLPEAFKRDFGIEIEYLAQSSSTAQVANRLVSEQGAGLYTVDVLTGGSVSLYTVLYPEKVIDPVRPVLIHPEVLDPSRWRAGRVWFMDAEDEYIVRLSDYVSLQLVVNTDHVRADAITSWDDLLRPEYRGKISVWDPTDPSGTGSNTAAYLLRELGIDYAKRLYVDQAPAETRDWRQWADWTGRGTHPIAIGLRISEIEALRADGFKVHVLPPFAKAPGYTTAGFGLGVLMKNAPHPNAAKLFMNWILMREGQTAWHAGEKTVSIRSDLENPWAPAYTVPPPGVPYFDTYDWNFSVRERQEGVQQMKALLGR
jgi:ABC-type Fe3+ transport system substrate-binding protein